MSYCVKCGNPLADGALFCPNCGNPVSKGGSAQVSATSVTGGLPDSGIKSLAEDQKAQSHWIRRLVALIIDSIILAIAGAILTTLLSIPFMVAGRMDYMSFFGGFPVIIGLFSILYFPAMEVYRGATLGKTVMGLKVTALNGAAPTWVQAFVRNVSKIYWVLLLLDVVLGLAIQTDYRQKFSDKYAGTVVTDK
jgi:uncharacterized RDD family membrane protein YckC